MTMKWIKPTPEGMAQFDSLLPVDSRLEKRKMFGYPCAFTNGNMFCGMHGNNIVIRLPESRRSELLAGGWKQFEPMPGRIMKEYLVVPEKTLVDKSKAKALFLESLNYAHSLPKKVKKK